MGDDLVRPGTVLSQRTLDLEKHFEAPHGLRQTLLADHLARGEVRGDPRIGGPRRNGDGEHLRQVWQTPALPGVPH